MRRARREGGRSSEAGKSLEGNQEGRTHHVSIMSEGHWDKHFICLIVTIALNGIPILEMRIRRLREVQVTFSQGQTRPNDPLSWNPDRLILSPKLFLPHQAVSSLPTVPI